MQICLRERYTHGRAAVMGGKEVVHRRLKSGKLLFTLDREPPKTERERESSILNSKTAVKVIVSRVFRATRSSQ